MRPYYIGYKYHRAGRWCSRIHVAFRLPRQHGVVYGMVIIRICIHLPCPITLLADVGRNVEPCRSGISSAHIHRLVSVYARHRIVTRRLRHVTVAVVERRARMPLADVRPVFSGIIDIGTCRDRPLQAGISLLNHKRLAVVAISYLVQQVGRGTVVSDPDTKVVLTVFRHMAEGGIGRKEHPSIMCQSVNDTSFVI